MFTNALLFGTLGMRLIGPHWDFALRIYGQPGVADLCVSLQDRFGVDVNVLLIALYSWSELDKSLTTEDLTAADELIGLWRSEVVIPLRMLRRRLKTGPQPAPKSSTDNLRGLLKRAELNAEQIEQGLLVDWIESLPAERPTRAKNARELVWLVAAHYEMRAPIDSSSQYATRLDDIDISPLIRALRR